MRRSVRSAVLALVVALLASLGGCGGQEQENRARLDQGNPAEDGGGGGGGGGGGTGGGAGGTPDAGGSQADGDEVTATDIRQDITADLKKLTPTQREYFGVSLVCTADLGEAEADGDVGSSGRVSKRVLSPCVRRVAAFKKRHPTFRVSSQASGGNWLGNVFGSLFSALGALSNQFAPVVDVIPIIGPWLGSAIRAAAPLLSKAGQDWLNQIDQEKDKQNTVDSARRCMVPVAAASSRGKALNVAVVWPEDEPCPRLKL